MSGYVDIVDVINARSLPQLGQAIRRLRKRRHLSQAELAQRAGVSRQWVVTAEQGRTRGLEIGHVMRVLDELDASLTVRDDLEPDAP
ncbi:MAG: helix-turn-helix domain-containing protein [Cellulomonas sp.]|nr:helix-turn-helix domain-containing protein [Cellulomonas sp.]